MMITYCFRFGQLTADIVHLQINLLTYLLTYMLKACPVVNKKVLKFSRLWRKDQTKNFVSSPRERLFFVLGAPREQDLGLCS